MTPHPQGTNLDWISAPTNFLRLFNSELRTQIKQTDNNAFLNTGYTKSYALNSEIKKKIKTQTGVKSELKPHTVSVIEAVIFCRSRTSHD